MINKHRQKKKKTSNKGLKVPCNCLKCQRFPSGQNLVSISTRTRHRKKYHQNENSQKSSAEYQESSKYDKDTEILDIESPNDDNFYQESNKYDEDTEILDIELLDDDDYYQESNK